MPVDVETRLSTWRHACRRGDTPVDVETHLSTWRLTCRRGDSPVDVETHSCRRGDPFLSTWRPTHNTRVGTWSFFCGRPTLLSVIITPAVYLPVGHFFEIFGPLRCRVAQHPTSPKGDRVLCHSAPTPSYQTSSSELRIEAKDCSMTGHTLASWLKPERTLLSYWLTLKVSQ